MSRPTFTSADAPPRFEEPLHVGGPNIGRRETFLGLVEGALDRRWLSNNGQLLIELEQRIAALLGVRNCVLVSSGTVALELSIRALGLAGEVIVPAFTFIATVHALQWSGLTPIFCDIDPNSHAIDPSMVEGLVTPRTTGILATHLWGEPCAIDILTEVAQRRGLRLLFDAAHAFGCTYRGRMIGNFGDAEVFSFHATKVFNTLEGGAIATNDDALAHQLRLMRNFGFTEYDRVDCLGTNAKMHEISAAMGLANLESYADFVAVNRRNFHAYRRELAGIPGMRLFAYDNAEQRNYQYVVLEVDANLTGITRDRFIEILRADNVLARRYFWPGCHRMEPYRSDPRYSDVSLPVTERVAGRVLLLPTGTTVSESAVATICEIIRNAVSANAPSARST
jgi:dTDP-4-amino-4,6-dideoxygalactose transaminase